MKCEDPGDGVGAVRTRVVVNPKANSTTITYICRPGRELQDGSLSIRCVAPGNWSNDAPNCIEPDGEPLISNTLAYIVRKSMNGNNKMSLLLLYPTLDLDI